MTALRERMTQDLNLRGLSLNTQAAYLRAVTQLARVLPAPIGGQVLPSGCQNASFHRGGLQDKLLPFACDCAIRRLPPRWLGGLE